MSPALVELNEAPRDQALELMAPLVERSAWVAEAALETRPFASDESLAAALVDVVLCAGRERRIALLDAHPELAGAEARHGRMSVESTGEQARLGLERLADGESDRLAALNAAYRRKFGHPFIVALHRISDRDALVRCFETRLAASPVEEHVTALAEIASVIRTRCRAAFGAPPVPLSTAKHDLQESTT